jgi:hypothetical protein
MLAKLAESALGMLGEARDINGRHLLNDELHDVWCVQRILMLKNGPKQLTLDEIHDINFLTFAIRTGLLNLVSMVKEIDKSSSNGIHISGLRSKVKPNHAKKNVEGGEEVLIRANR